MPLPKRYNLGWRVNFSKDGKKVRRWFPISQHLNDSAAYTAACRFVEETLAGKQPERKQGHDLKEKINQYNIWSEKVRKKHPVTINRQIQCLRVFINYCTDNSVSLLSQIDLKLLLDFQQYFYANAPFNGRQKENYDPSSNWHHYHQFVNAFMNWSLERSYIETNPAKHKSLKPKYEKRLPNPFTKEELKMMFRFLDKETPLISTYFRTILYTGMRPGEAISLKWEQVNFKNNVIHVVKTKTKTPRSIPLHPELRKLLNSLPKDFTYVFDSGQNEPLGNNNYYYHKMRRACVIMDIPRHKPYDLRHTFATRLVEQGIHLGAVSELLGHSSIEQTMVYVHFAPRHLKNAIESLSF